MGKKRVYPIQPEQARSKPEIPDVVIEVFNRLIARNLQSGSARIFQEDVVKILVDEHGLDREEIFNKHFLDVEGIYRAAGWLVEYDKPGYNESYAASFVFSEPRKS